MRDIKNEIYTKYIDTWLRQFNGRGSISILKPLNANDFVIAILKRIVSRKPESKIFICVDTYWRRKDILEKCTNNNISTENLTVISETYVNARFTYSYDLSICIGLKQWSSTSDVVISQAKWYLFVITDSEISSNKLTEIYKHYACVNAGISSKESRAVQLSSPVEDVRVKLTLNDVDAAKYNEYTEFIQAAINIFGSFENIHFAISGDKSKNLSAEDIRLSIAKINGWSENLDCSIPFNKQIDDYFNPNAIYQRAINVNDIIKRRHILCDSNKDKINAVVKIILENPGKRFIVISKRDDTANGITKAINDALGYEACGDYHDNIEPRVLLDDNGVPLLYKSGVNKGKPRIIKSQAISTANANRYEDDREAIIINRSELSDSSLSDRLSILNLMSCLSCKFASNDGLAVSCDGIILVSQNVGGFRDIMYRFNNLTFDVSPIPIYRLYFAGTYEQDKIEKEKDDSYAVIKSYENSDENLPDIVCG